MSILNWLKNLFAESEHTFNASGKYVKKKTEDVVEEVKNTVSEGFEEVKEKAGEKVTRIRKRARDKFGRFIPDDPDTEKNEAYKD